MAANDYLMRQIEDMARFLGKVLFVKTEETIPLFDEQGNVLESGLLYKRLCSMLEEGDANSAENLLFDEVEAHPDPAYLQVAVQFYADLQHWTDAALEAADFSRQEVLDGLAAVKELYEKRAGGQKAKKIKQESCSMTEFRYDTQLLIEGENLDEDTVHDHFTRHFKGDCLLAVGDENLIKIHFHTNEPWQVLEYCAGLGEIFDIVVEDMDRQARGLKG